MNKLYLLIEASRVYALPMTIFSWLVVFVYSAIDSGNILYGIIAFIGICFVHLATNMIDDFIDYKSLIKQVNFNKELYLSNTQKTKCRYLIEGRMNEFQLLCCTSIYLFLALICGIFLFYKCGVGVFYFAIFGAIIVCSYPFLSRICLSEVAVALTYGPAIYGGVYYVMTGTYSWNVILLSVPTMLITVVLLYIHTVMDYEFDLGEAKRTIANRFSSNFNSLIVLKYMLIVTYLSLILMCIFDILDWQVFIVYLTVPIALDLYDSMIEYTKDNGSIPRKKWFHFPMENLDYFIQSGEASFMIRIYQARNLMIYFSLFFILSMILSLVL